MTIPRTILLVEDQEEFRILIGENLKAEGYAVTLANDGMAALQLAVEQDKRFDLVITDIEMPRLNGVELGKKLVSHNDKIKILFLSGYSQGNLTEVGLPAEKVNFLQKPFNRKTLLEKISSIFKAEQ